MKKAQIIFAQKVSELKFQVPCVFFSSFTSMYTKYIVIYNDAQCQEIEHISKMVPDVRIAVFPRTFRVKAVRLCDTSGLVVAANKVNPVGVS